MQRFAGPAYQRAIQSLDDAIERLGGAGYDRVERASPLAARLRSSAGKRALRLDMSREGKVFGGNYALELSTADPMLPATRGLTARGKGVVQMRGVAFRARRGDEPRPRAHVRDQPASAPLATRDTHRAVSFSCTAFCLRRASSAGKSTASSG